MTIDGQLNDAIGRNGNSTLEHWKTIDRLRKELENELREVDAPYWLAQMGKLKARCTYELDRTNAVKREIWWQSRVE